MILYAAGAYIILLIAMVLGVRRRRIVLPSIAGVLTIAVTVLCFVIYPTMLRNSPQHVSVQTDYLVNLNGERESQAYEFDKWVKESESNLEVLVEIEDQDRSRKTLIPKTDVILTPMVSLIWYESENSFIQERRPRLNTVTCVYENPLVQFVENGCMTSTQRYALHVPGGEEYAQGK